MAYTPAPAQWRARARRTSATNQTPLTTRNACCLLSSLLTLRTMRNPAAPKSSSDAAFIGLRTPGSVAVVKPSAGVLVAVTGRSDLEERALANSTTAAAQVDADARRDDETVESANTFSLSPLQARVKKTRPVKCFARVPPAAFAVMQNVLALRASPAPSPPSRAGPGHLPHGVLATHL